MKTEIKGYRAASKALGVDRNRVRRFVEQGFGKDKFPKKVKGSGPSGFNWRWKNQEHLAFWWRLALDEWGTIGPKKVLKKKLTKEKMMSKELPEGAVVGTRSAAAVLGVKPSYVAASIKKLGAKKEYKDLIPKTSPFRKDGQRASVPVYFWDSEAAIVAWWEEVTPLLGLNGAPRRSTPPPARKSAPKDPPAKKQPDDERDASLIEHLLGREVLAAVAALRERLDTPSVRVYREIKGDPSPSTPLADVVQIIVARGLATLEEEV